MKRETLATAGILVLALALRLARLTLQPLWADEGYSVYFAGMDWVALTRATAADIHPPLYYYLLKLWMAFFGPGEFSLRLLSVGLGVATVALAYALAQRLVGRRVAVVAALLLALSPFHVYYSQEVRMYALAGLLAVASVLFMVQVLAMWSGAPPVVTGEDPRGRRRRTPFVLYAIITALSLHTLYYCAFLPLAQTVFVAVRYRRQPRLIVRWLGLQVAVLVLYLPWMVGATGALATYVGGKVAVEKYLPLDPLSFFAQVLAALGMGAPSAGRTMLALGAVPLLGLAVLAVGRALVHPHPIPLPSSEGGSVPSPSLGAGWGEGRSGDQPWPVTLLATLVVVPLVLGYIVNVFAPFSPVGFQRLFLYCLPFLLILSAQGLVSLRRWIPLASETIAQHGAGMPRGYRAQHLRPVLLLFVLVAGAACALATLADFYVSPRYARHDYRPLVRQMQALAHPDDVVVALYPWQIGFVRSYFVGQPPSLVFVDRAAQWALYPAVMGQDLQRWGREHGRMWFMSYEAAGRLLETAVTSYLDEAAFPALSQWSGDHRLLLYSFGAAGTVQRSGITVGSALMLDSASVSLDPVEAGKDCVRVDLRWRSPLPFPVDSQVALRLVDDAGRVWARRDSATTGGRAPLSNTLLDPGGPDHHAVLIPVTTPPGMYRLLLAVYDRAAGRNLPLADAAGQSLGTEIEISKIVITRSVYHLPLEALGIPRVVSARFVDGPRLVGYNLAATPLRPGHPMGLDLYWQAEEVMADDPVLFVQVRDRANKLWGLYEGAAVAPQYPPSRWGKGEVLRGQISLLLAPDAPAGEYRIVVGWLKGRSKERLALVGGGNEVTVARVQVVTRPHVMTLPQPARPLDERLGDDVQLLGFDADLDGAQAGAALPLALYWRALGRMDVAYTVFVHLVDEKGVAWAQADSEPRAGDMPTTSWLPGEVITDTYQLALPANLPRGVYTLLTGMYDKATWARLPVRNVATGRSGDAVQLGRVQIR